MRIDPAIDPAEVLSEELYEWLIEVIGEDQARMGIVNTDDAVARMVVKLRNAGYSIVPTHIFSKLEEVAKYALHLRMYGERAPGGDETWREFDQMAETMLRTLTDYRVRTAQKDPT